MKGVPCSIQEVVNYIGRYTHRVAISNQRILAVNEKGVQFRYKDYRNSRTCWRTMQLAPPEFIRRFLWHVLPPGFHKIRHYGFLANGRRKANVTHIGMLLSNRAGSEEKATQKDSGRPCPVCEKGRVRPVMIFGGLGRLVSRLLPTRTSLYAFDTS